ncbi:hypothetical protein Cgig2_025541 [Carnegiea gigantea]|uniref:Alpha/beta hydrolase fold-3 domain-containing protein n=1 Tax=Carnegiea gigantea TaxID=171969 RepID=A0A9Q1KB88_9CARY|nr:hypothetical protein Cgig2_025541 [Carnegiea gigantea]
MAADRVDDLKPLILKGIVMIQPYFGGSELSGSELRLINDLVLPLDANELMWSLTLPVGATRNHEYCNPTLGGGSGLLDRVWDLEWRVGMVTSDGDPLFDRAVELVKLMEKRGIGLKSLLSEVSLSSTVHANVSDIEGPRFNRGDLKTLAKFKNLG